MPAELFNPKVDGWLFENWGEASGFDWDLFRDTYLGVNPTEDCLEAPFDCSFFPLFKDCAKLGNCGGMSILALALYKYGGYFGFCKPAYFYAGDNGGPYRPDLRRAINIIQARQFNVNGIRNFMDMWKAGTLNNAVVAHQRVKELLATGDYPVLWINTGLWDTNAHTVIPYNYTDGPGFPKYLNIWDSNHPSDASRMMTINGDTDWTYTSKNTTYSGLANGWCFVVPMSLILHKARHPVSMGFAVDNIMTLFVTGSGAAIGQISDEDGRRLYRKDSDFHVSRGDLETDPARRLSDCCRWPLYGRERTDEQHSEIYFYQRNLGVSSCLAITLHGTRYRAVYSGANNLIVVEANSGSPGRDEVNISALGSAHQSVGITASRDGRSIAIRQTRMGTDAHSWRALEVRDLDLTKGDRVTMGVTSDFRSVIVSADGREVPFSLRMEQGTGKKSMRRDETKLSTKPNQLSCIKADDWMDLEKTIIRKEEISIPRGLLPQKANLARP
jgi:hypothetical protein